MKTQAIIDEIDRLSAHHYRRFPVVLEKARGVWLWDTEGKRYLDMLASYSAISVGHNHARIKRVLQQNVPLASHVFYSVPEHQCLRALTRVSGMEAGILTSTGAEAWETAVKLARKWGYTRKCVPRDEAEIIVAHGNFHGRTVTAISASDQRRYRYDFGPHTPGFVWASFGDSYALEKLINPNTVAVILEPIQGEGGVNVPPANYLLEVKEICKKRDILFVLDEVQTGFGRTGKMFAFEHEGAKPDLLIVAKALGGGQYPVSAVLGPRKFIDIFEVGEHGSTFGGNALACAVGHEAIQIIEDENLCARAANLGTYLLERLKSIDSPLIKEVRGKGLLVGVEFSGDVGGAYRVCEQFLKRGIVCLPAREHTVRFSPPLTIRKQHLNLFLKIFEEVLRAIS